jgi:hypothetical protein
LLIYPILEIFLKNTHIYDIVYAIAGLVAVNLPKEHVFDYVIGP